MGKVREEEAAKVSKPSAGKPAGPKKGKGRVASFLGNFVQLGTYKPNQGRLARTWTGVGLGVLVAAGLVALYNYQFADYPPLTAYGIPTAVGLVFGWVIWRLLQYPPFVDFLIATEAEMNKVSWTSRDDLYRATIVVLSTVLIMAMFLFGVDVVWSKLLQLIGVLRFQGFTPAEG